MPQPGELLVKLLLKRAPSVGFFSSQFATPIPPPPAKDYQQQYCPSLTNCTTRNRYVIAAKGWHICVQNVLKCIRQGLRIEAAKLQASI
eukprot:3618559-Amphidinium_carterae.1